MNAGGERTPFAQGNASSEEEQEAMYLDMDVTEEPLIDENVVSDDWIDPATKATPKKSGVPVTWLVQQGTPKNSSAKPVAKFNQERQITPKNSSPDSIAMPMILVANKSLEKVLKRGHDQVSGTPTIAGKKFVSLMPGTATTQGRNMPIMTAAKGATNVSKPMHLMNNTRPPTVSTMITGTSKQMTVSGLKTNIVPNTKATVISAKPLQPAKQAVSVKSPQPTKQTKYVSIVSGAAGGKVNVIFPKTSSTFIQQGVATGIDSSTIQRITAANQKAQLLSTAARKPPAKVPPTKLNTLGASSSSAVLVEDDEPPPIAIKDIRQCIPEESDGLHVLHAKLDYTNQMLKTQQTLIARLRHQSGLLIKSNTKLTQGLKELETVTQTTAQMHRGTVF